jgi:molybdopterin-guanine dinucleotide biosynthesis protein B
MRVLGIAGYSGSGKTTLVARLLPLLKARGLEVATLKHAHHGFDPLPEGHHAAQWRAAGAHEIMLVNAKRQLLMHELRGEPEPAMDAMLSRLSPVDLVLIEGYKFGAHDKIEVYRRANRSPLFAATDRRVIALATDCGRPDGLSPERGLPIFELDDSVAIAAFIVEWHADRHAAALTSRSPQSCLS